MTQYHIFILLSLPAVITGIVTFRYIYEQREGNRGFLLLLLIMNSVLILVLQCGELLSQSPEAVRLFSNTNYMAVTLTPVLWFLFALTEFRPGYNLKSPWILLFFILPAITSILVWTNSLHHLIWMRHELVNISVFLINIVYRYGPWFWIHSAYSYGLLLAGVILIIVAQVQKPTEEIFRGFLTIIATLIPFVFNLIYMSRILPGPDKDFSPVSFILTCLLFSFAIKKYGLARTKPVPEIQAVDALVPGLLVLDRTGIITSFYDAEHNEILLQKPLLIGKHVESIIPKIVLPTTDSDTSHFIMKHRGTVQNPTSGITLHFHIQAFKDDGTDSGGYFLFLTDRAGKTT